MLIMMKNSNDLSSFYIEVTSQANFNTTGFLGGDSLD